MLLRNRHVFPFELYFEEIWLLVLIYSSKNSSNLQDIYNAYLGLEHDVGIGDRGSDGGARKLLDVHALTHVVGRLAGRRHGRDRTRRAVRRML